MQSRFTSHFEYAGTVPLPAYSGLRIMMMPVVLGDLHSLPRQLDAWKDTLARLFDMQDYSGHVGYITIDEKMVGRGHTHRRNGVHVDGIYKKYAGSWGGGWGGGGRPSPTPRPLPSPQPRYSSPHGTGFLTVSSHAACKAWNQEFTGWPQEEGECEHLAYQCHEKNAHVFGAGDVYWADPLCVHQSMRMASPTPRQFVRLSLPSNAPWFEGYTENELGVKPTGPILARRVFMDA